MSWCLPWYCVIQCSSGDYNLSVEWHVVYKLLRNVNVVYDCIVIMLCMTVCSGYIVNNCMCSGHDFVAYTG